MEPDDSESHMEDDDSCQNWDYLNAYLEKKYAAEKEAWARENRDVDLDRDWTDDEDEAYENQFERTKF